MYESVHVHVAPTLNAAFRVGTDGLLSPSLISKDRLLTVPPILNWNWLVKEAETVLVIEHASCLPQ